MTLPTVVASTRNLDDLLIPARTRIEPGDVVVPDGYRVEVVLAGLSMPCGMGVSDDGTVFVCEGGCASCNCPTWTR